jgi:hypothetical protein
MTGEQLFRNAFVALEVNAAFSEAVVRMRDASRLCFAHRVGERWAKAVVDDEKDKDSALAAVLLGKIALFRLNAKHLEVEFQDGSRWQAQFGR